jgi:hypothetical protein
MSGRKRAGSKLRSGSIERRKISDIGSIRGRIYGAVTQAVEAESKGSRDLTIVPGIAMNRSSFCRGIVFASHSVPDDVGFATRQVMDPKLTLLFLLIGAVIVLSNLGDDSLTRMRRQLADRPWRNLMRVRRKY